jgi:hypothetical protein
MNDLTGIACSSDSLCFAAGTSYLSGPNGYSAYRTLIDRWNGSSWSIVDSPNGASNENNLFRVSCASSTLCFAVGYEGPFVPNGHVLMERWDGGAWTIVSPPRIAGAQNSLLRDIQCLSSTLCFAVGQYLPSGAYVNSQGLIEQWDGRSWTVKPDVHEGLLYAVSCASAFLCFALGVDYTFETGHEVQHSIAERWDGSTWGVVPSGLGDVRSEVLSASCASETVCFASGYIGDGQAPDAPMIEAWDGKSWRLVYAPQPSVPVSPAKIDDQLVSVSCASGSFCLAVGWHRWSTPQTALSDTLVERWDGISWTIVRSPNGSPSPGFSNALMAVACPTKSRCMAIGHYDAPDGYLQVLAELWNGTSWSVVRSANR